VLLGNLRGWVEKNITYLPKLDKTQSSVNRTVQTLEIITIDEKLAFGQDNGNA